MISTHTTDPFEGLGIERERWEMQRLEIRMPKSFYLPLRCQVFMRCQHLSYPCNGDGDMLLSHCSLWICAGEAQFNFLDLFYKSTSTRNAEKD